MSNADASTTAELDLPSEVEGAAAAPGAVTTARGHIRGSVMLLVGRLTAMLIAFGTQVITVRYLSKSDYGAFAYGLSIVALVQAFLAVGLDRADTRFLCLYEERRDRGRFLGVIVTEAATILSLGVATLLVVALGRHMLFGGGNASQVTTLVAVLIVLAPTQALDTLIVNCFAVLSKPRAVFIRRYLMEPSLRLAAVLAVVALGQSVGALAVGYVVAGAVALTVYSITIIPVLRRSPVFKLNGRRLRMPLRELFGFSVPLLTTNLTFTATTTFGAVLLGKFGNLHQVAAYRAVQPVAALNMMVLLSFGTLFTPVAARFHARGNTEAMRHLYWQTTAWMAVLTLPVFLMSTAFASPLTTTVFGSRYSSSAPILAVLAIGYYVNAAMGFNGTVLQILGATRYVVLGNLTALAFCVITSLALIPAFGALGAAVSASASVVVHNIIKQAGVRRYSRIGVYDNHYTPVFLVIALSLVACELLVPLKPSLPAAVGIVALATGAVLLSVRRQLRLADTFPEIGRLPLLRKVFVA